tara:strand:- start:546 stop:857 length:312 start_codon:yes stop_codon:yes gene_type:complete
MTVRKLIIGFFILSILGGCSAPSAMLGPVYTFSSTGNVFQTGLTYGSNHLIEKHTGKSTIENLQELSTNNHKNVQTRTLESEEFHSLVKSKIKKNSKILKLSN